MLSSLRKQGTINVTVRMDSRCRGNARSCYVIITEKPVVIVLSKSAN